MSDTPSYDPPKPPASSGGLPPALANISGSTLLWVQVGGGLLAAVSTFFPWITVTVSFLGTGVSESGNGYDEGLSPYGLFILLLGLIVAALAFIKVRNIQVQGLDKLPALLPLILSGLMLLLAVIKWIDVLTTGDDFGGFGSGVDVSSGFGIWLVLLGSLATFGAALMPVLKARQS
jgi:hypothetical protein